MQPVVEPATISKVLLEVIGCSDAHLTREAVIDFLDDVILGFATSFCMSLASIDIT